MLIYLPMNGSGGIANRFKSDIDAAQKNGLLGIRYVKCTVNMNGSTGVGEVVQACTDAESFKGFPGRAGNNNDPLGTVVE